MTTSKRVDAPTTVERSDLMPSSNTKTPFLYLPSALLYKKKGWAAGMRMRVSRSKNGFLTQPSSRSKTFTTSLSQPQGCLESPQLALQPLWIDGKCKKWILSPLGPRLHPASTSELRNGERKVHPGRGRAEGTQRDLPGRREPRGRACWLVVHRAVAGVHAWLHTHPCSAGKSTM